MTIRVLHYGKYLTEYATKENALAMVRYYRNQQSEKANREIRRIEKAIKEQSKWTQDKHSTN